MRAGKLRSKINILRYKNVQDEAGGLIGMWTVHIPNLRCDDRVVSSRDNMRNSIEISEETHTIEVRYRDDILSTDRVQLSDGRTLAIIGKPKVTDQKKRSLIITARYDDNDEQRYN